MMHYALQADGMRPFLEKRSGLSLTHSSHLRAYIPIIHKFEIDRIKKSLKRGSGYTVIFDGSSRVDEVLAVILRFVTTDFTMVQELVHLGKYQSCKDHEQIMNAINTVLVNYGVCYGHSHAEHVTEHGGVIAFQKDRASANESSMGALLTLFKGSANLHCLSHTVTHVGEHMKAKAVKAFKEDLCALCNSHGGNNKAAAHW